MALSKQFPLPDIEIEMPFFLSSAWYSMEQYWLPRTPFCLSSGDSSGVDFLLTLHDEREDLSCKISLQGSNGVEFGMPFGDSTSDVVLGPLVGAQATDGDNVQRAIGGAIAAGIETMPDDFS
jgi:hypothetical protein